ncbi:MAG: hypothetical protein KDB05_09245 [Planctomycetales bacterium]|nr:hypothetical protein [Planctomycetales bacterium]
MKFLPKLLTQANLPNYTYLLLLYVFGPNGVSMFLRLLAATALFLATSMVPGAVQAQEASTIRPLAPGVLTVIPTATEEGETFNGPLPLVEVVTGIPDLDWTPNYTPKTNTLQEIAKQVVLRRTIWDLEFAFKPLRMIEVDVPQPTGNMQRKLIWYMVYRVSNRGLALNPTESVDSFGHRTYTIEKVNYPTRRFFPHFVLESREYQKSYLDRIIPAAQLAIQKREDPGTKLLNSIEMTRVQIPLSDERIERGIWGVVTWEDIDPRLDFFSVYIRGLTNAFEFVDPPGAYRAGQPPGSGRVYNYKTLQLNFWRPGDSVLEHEREVRYGVPVDSDPVLQAHILDAFGLPERLDHLWIYR